MLNQPPFVASTRSDEELPVLIQVRSMRRMPPPHFAPGRQQAEAHEASCLSCKLPQDFSGVRAMAPPCTTMFLQIFRMCGKPTANTWPELANPATFSRPYDEGVFPQIPEGAFSSRFISRLQRAQGIETEHSKTEDAATMNLLDEELDFIKMCLQVAPGLRATADELLAHPFLRTSEAVGVAQEGSAGLSPVARCASDSTGVAATTSRTAGSVSWGVPAAREGALSTHSTASNTTGGWGAAAAGGIAARTTSESSAVNSPAMLELPFVAGGASGARGRVAAAGRGAAAGLSQPLALPAPGRTISLIPAVDENGVFLGMVCPEDVMAGRPRHEIPLYKPVPTEAVHAARSRAAAQATRSGGGVENAAYSMPGGTGIADGVMMGRAGEREPTVTATTATGAAAQVECRGTTTTRGNRTAVIDQTSTPSPEMGVFGGAKRRRQWPASAAAGAGRLADSQNETLGTGARPLRALGSARGRQHHVSDPNIAAQSHRRRSETTAGAQSAGKKSRASDC